MTPLERLMEMARATDASGLDRLDSPNCEARRWEWEYYVEANSRAKLNQSLFNAYHHLFESR